MGTGFEHTALAVFTTLAPMGAGAFIALAYAFFVGAPDDAAAKRLDRWTALPLVVLAVGFLGAFMHLASPLNAFGVFTGVGSSPLSNEILVGVAFAALAVVYWESCRLRCANRCSWRWRPWPWCSPPSAGWPT